MKIITAVMIMFIIGLSAQCYGDYQPADENQRVFEGTVVSANVGNSVLTVSGAVQIDFPISSDTSLKRDIYDIKLSDINKGDYVTVQYYREGSDSRVPARVTNVTVEYGP